MADPYNRDATTTYRARRARKGRPYTDDAALLAPALANLRVQALVLETWGSTPNLRVQALALEAWTQPATVNLKVSELALETWAINAGSLRVSALVLETWTPAAVAQLTLSLRARAKLDLSSSLAQRSLSLSPGTPLLDLVGASLPLFPTLLGLQYPVTKELVYGVLTQALASGRELRLREWVDPVWRYTLSFEFLRQGPAYLELQALMGLFLQSLGQDYLFYYHDTDDDTATRVLIGDAINNPAPGPAQTQYQLLRGFYDGSGNIIATAPVYVPLTSTVSVYLNTAVDGTGGTLADPSTYSVTPWGKVIFDSPPGTGGAPGAHYYISASCMFYQLCRFEDDQNDFDGLWYNFFELKQLKFKTVKPTNQLQGN